jgi:hypothetical protein
LIPLSVVIFTKPSFGRDEYDKDTASTTKNKTKQEKVVQFTVYLAAW